MTEIFTIETKYDLKLVHHKIKSEQSDSLEINHFVQKSKSLSYPHC